MIDKRIKKDFVRFLKESGKYHSYCNNTKDYQYQYRRKRIAYFLDEITGASSYLTAAFDWRSTKEGSGYWENALAEWGEYYKKNTKKTDKGNPYLFFWQL